MLNTWGFTVTNFVGLTSGDGTPMDIYTYTITTHIALTPPGGPESVPMKKQSWREMLLRTLETRAVAATTRSRCVLVRASNSSYQITLGNP